MAKELGTQVQDQLSTRELAQYVLHDLQDLAQQGNGQDETRCEGKHGSAGTRGPFRQQRIEEARQRAGANDTVDGYLWSGSGVSSARGVHSKLSKEEATDGNPAGPCLAQQPPKQGEVTVTFGAVTPSSAVDQARRLLAKRTKWYVQYLHCGTAHFHATRLNLLWNIPSMLGA